MNENTALRIYDVGIISKLVTVTIKENRKEALEGKFREKRGTFTMSYNVLIIPHKNCNEPVLNLS